MRFHLMVKSRTGQTGCVELRIGLVVPRPLVYICANRIHEAEIVQGAWPQLPCKKAYFGIDQLAYLRQSFDPLGEFAAGPGQFL